MQVIILPVEVLFIITTINKIQLNSITPVISIQLYFCY
ncbi:hypothetical protein M23134_03143 [Microscilla marina ATCC 23134]|uniref:Uncharacterized protein n=1 Tax=Microscilla marina ATCC 23134 TaxID=313606 RepID=A1ZG90_MICM2|nr:hypothetical protein M23134_03143 [Microscilla marina ATCC 23134]